MCFVDGREGGGEGKASEGRGQGEGWDRMRNWKGREKEEVGSE